MELILQQGLPHQQKAIDTICKVFSGVNFTKPMKFYENPHIDLNDYRIFENIKEIQKNIPTEYHSNLPVGRCLNLDIKMETGTGKTYVYTKTMFELHKCYGINKFIIAVPSLAIKAGTAQFLKDNYARKHFSDSCGYGTEMEVGVLESPKNKKKGHSYFPSVVNDFIRGSCQNTKKIYVILVNMQLLTNAKMLSRNDYDYGAEGFCRPFDAIRATDPFVIIDEPHRFTRTQAAFKVISEEICPQCIIRFGATFPEIANGKNKSSKDYQNLLYDLNACAAFNQGLIKGVSKEHFEPVSKREEKVRITAIKSKEEVHFQYKKRDESTRNFTLRTDDSLAYISDVFEGITISAIGKSSVEFSNGISKTVGEELDVDIYMTSYQEQMMRLALQRHFETERENFCNRKFKIKTLALFFIDDITSYRKSDDGKALYLLNSFERLLKEQIENTLSRLDEREYKYRDYLEASLADISACHAGYFSQDNSNSDEDIVKEVNEILHEKKHLLSFRNEDGSYNTLRFLFSKWTLKEGWDNPNVFTIAKLRSSGSENSKLQEVGRGLRLPVDENGNRISNEEFQLNYIVDFVEADFAKDLVEQINSELPQTLEISNEKLEMVAKKLGISAEDLFDELYNKHYIGWNNKIKSETRDQFFEEYPDFATGLSSGKVEDRNKTKPKLVRIRKDVYSKMKELWEIINRRYLLFYDSELDNNMESVVLSILESKNIFTDVVISSDRKIICGDGNEMLLKEATGVQYVIYKPIPYNVFLKRISKTTNLPINVIHSAMCAYSKKYGTIDERYINENTVIIFCSEFAAWKNENLLQSFHYERSSTPLGATALTYEDGSPRGELAQGRIGIKVVQGTPGEKYLYDVYAYDSPLERSNIIGDNEAVVAYGKIPRNSIAIPTITGGMYSPDFMYVIQSSDGDEMLNIIVETKDVEDRTQLRGSEKAKIYCAKLLFEKLLAEGDKVHFVDQLNNKKMAHIINELLECE